MSSPPWAHEDEAAGTQRVHGEAPCSLLQPCCSCCSCCSSKSRLGPLVKCGPSACLCQMVPSLGCGPGACPAPSLLPPLMPSSTTSVRSGPQAVGPRVQHCLSQAQSRELCPMALTALSPHWLQADLPSPRSQCPVSLWPVAQRSLNPATHTHTHTAAGHCWSDQHI